MNQWTVPGYTALKPLGSGGFGTVILARHDATGMPVAIKYLRQEMLSDPQFAPMFRAEAVTLSSLNDPYVVRLYEYVESPAGAAIVMELVDGVSLREILSRHGKTTPQAALMVLLGSLLGLAAAHARGVVHRDYKPENVLINGYGASKLTDFGIAARTGTRGVEAATLAYAPPEQFDGAPASPASDVYAATATFYECLTGHPPFSGQTTEALISQHRSAPVPMEPVPGPLRPLVARGMAKDPAYRPADAGLLAAGLRTAATEAYGRDWEFYGRSHLGEVALLLAALWPSAGVPALHGSTVEQVHLTQSPRQTGGARGAREARNAQHAGQGRVTRAEQHEWHLRHILHLDHLAHLRYLRRLSAALPVAAAAAVVAAGVTVAVSGHSGNPPSSAHSGTGVTSYQVPLQTIPITTSNVTAADNDVYVRYDGSGDSTATISGTITGATSSDVVRLYAQQFPFTSAPAVAGSVPLNPSGSTATYSFQATPSLATRYQVKLFSSAAATTPVAESAVTTIYVVATFVQNFTPTCTGGSTCQETITETIYQPASTLPTEMPKHWYVYSGFSTTSEENPPVVQLVPGAVVTAARQVGPNSYTRTITYSYPASGGASPYSLICFKDTEAQDGTGLPNASGCGDPSVSTTAYLG